MQSRSQQLFKFALILFILLLYRPVLAADNPINTWHPANNARLSWDASIEQGDIKYQVFIVREESVDKEVDKVQVGETVEIEFLVPFTERGFWILGVRVVLTETSPVSGTYELLSDISWSDNPDVVDGGVTFGVEYNPAIPYPVNLRLGG